MSDLPESGSLPRSTPTHGSLPHSSVVVQLAELCRRHPVAPKVVFVPYQQLGRALETALARHAGRWGGVQCVTPATHASFLAEGCLPDASRRLGSTGRELLVRSILEDLQSGGTLGELGRIERVAPQFATALDTLRTADVSPGDLEEKERTGLASHLPPVYRAYVDALSAHDLHDEADLFRWAVEAAREGRGAHRVYAVCGETELHELALRLLDALRQHTELVLLGTSNDDRAPEHSASALVAEWPGLDRIPEPDPSASGSPPVAPTTTHTRRAVGPIREVRAVLRDVLDRDTPLDEIEIAYTTSRPYLSLLVDEAEKAGIPVTSGTGLPAGVTRPAQMLIGVYRWIEDGFNAEILIRLLRSGLLRTDRWMRDQQEADSGDTSGPGDSADLPFVTATEIATILAESRYPPHREGYESVLSARIENERKQASDLPEDSRVRAQAEARVDRLGVVRHLVRTLLRLLFRKENAPGTTGEADAEDENEAPLASKLTVEAMADRSEELLRQFGPSLHGGATPGRPVLESDDRPKTYDQIAQGVLRDKVFPELRRVPDDVRRPVRDLAVLFRETIEESYVGAEQPRPGAAHILPLDSAGFSGRASLYVVGLDSDTTRVPAIDGAVLDEALRASISTGQAGVLPQPRAAADEAAWRFQVALDRHHGPQTLVAMHFDPEKGEERFPSSLFLSRQRESGAEPTRELLVPESGRPLLSDAEAWMATGREGAPNDRTTGRPSARDRLHDAFPHVQKGEEARAARAAERYTAYDGLLDGPCPKLDFLAPDYDGSPMSANRLQTLAESPYGYFVKYVLGVRPLDEPALSDDPWLTALRKGSILHDAFEWLMSDAGRRAEIGSGTAFEKLRDWIEEKVDEIAARVHVGEGETREGIVRQLLVPARLFVEAEKLRKDQFTPARFEWGFGYDGPRKKEGDRGETFVQVGPDARLPLRGRIDRIDVSTGPDGGKQLHVWDYKTGGQSTFEATNPLKDGAKLQWALYAAVAEAHFDVPVAESGYFFPSEKEMGTRLGWSLDADRRAEMEAILQRLAELTRTGTFPMRPDPKEASIWAFGEYADLLSDLDARTRQLQSKSYPDDRPKPPFWEE